MSVRTGREDGPRCGRHGLHPPQENATPRPPFIELLFAIPSAPDLGAPAGRRHGFRVLSDVNLWNALPPSDRGRHLPHQVYARVKAGRSGLHARAKVWARRDLDPLILAGLMPDAVLGGDDPVPVGRWAALAPQPGEMAYWFSAELRDPVSLVWEPAASVGHSQAVFEHGTLSTVAWNGAGGARDYDDLVLEVAIVRRDAWFERLHAAVVEREGDAERVVREHLARSARRRAS